MRREDIYKELQKIVAPIHSHSEQLMAIASWFEQKLTEKTPKVFLVEYRCGDNKPQESESMQECRSQRL